MVYGDVDLRRARLEHGAVVRVVVDREVHRVDHDSETLHLLLSFVSPFVRGLELLARLLLAGTKRPQARVQLLYVITGNCQGHDGHLEFVVDATVAVLGGVLRSGFEALDVLSLSAVDLEEEANLLLRVVREVVGRCHEVAQLRLRLLEGVVVDFNPGSTDFGHVAFVDELVSMTPI